MSHALFDPITLRGVEVRNRLWIPPMCQYAVEKQDGVATDWHFAHLGSLASGGAGAVIVEASAVSPEGRISQTDLGLWNDAQRDALAPIVRYMHSHGATVGIQLAHAGRKASVWPEWGLGDGAKASVPIEDGGWETLAPSAVAYPGFRAPKALDESGILELVAAFAAAARRAVDAGIDMVEIHAAHGYLIHEFLSPLSNKRTDRFGGSAENRIRFLLMVVDAIRDVVGDSVPLLVRLSATDWREGGITIDDTVRTVKSLRDHGVDLIDVSSGGSGAPDIAMGPGYQVPFAAEIRHRTGVPTGAVGLITDPAQAHHIVATGQADVVLIGREALRDPHFPIRAAEALRVDTAYVPGPYRRAFTTGRTGRRKMLAS